jgi:excisionase family DNA binding protein
MYNLVYNVNMEFMTNDEVAKKLRVNARTVDRWLKNGLLKGYKLGSSRTALWRIPVGEFKKFLVNHENKKKK